MTADPTNRVNVDPLKSTAPRSAIGRGAVDEDPHQTELTRGERFDFGRNWAYFLETIDERRIAAAEDSLRTMLECTNLEGRSFLDVGSGSGLFSLAAFFRLRPAFGRLHKGTREAILP